MMPHKPPPLNSSQALVEAGRCLGCYDAPCVQACPAGVNVPGFIQRFREENLAGASALIYSACPLGHICGTACPTETLCEGACVLQDLGQAPIRIGALQAYITAACPTPEPPGDLTPGRVAVIGAGPSGLGCAVQLNRLGHPVTVYDRRETLGGMVSRVIPYHRLPGDDLQVDFNRPGMEGIDWVLGKAVDEASARAILRDYDAVFLGVGMQRPVVVGEARLPVWNAYSALDFLEEKRSLWPSYLRDQADQAGEWYPPLAHQRVVVVGAGNVALDAAVVAKRLGARDVIVLYRRSITEMPGWQSEYLEACALGVEFRWMSGFYSLDPDLDSLEAGLTDPELTEAELAENRAVLQKIAVYGEEVRGVRVQPMRFSAELRGGRRWVEPDPHALVYDLECDCVLFAAGQELEAESARIFNADAPSGAIQTGGGSSRTTNPKIFAAGEAVSGGSTIVACMAAGMAAGREIHAWFAEERKRHG